MTTNNETAISDSLSALLATLIGLLGGQAPDQLRGHPH